MDKKYYHGTNKNNIKSILKSKEMNFSRGDRHWLGDGIYFYEEEFYAYNWLVYDYKYKCGKESYDKEKINKDYGIISVNLDVIEERIFSFEKGEHKILYDIAFEKANNKIKNSLRFKEVKFCEGVVLNIMFKELGYNEKYDLITAIFTRRKTNYKGIDMRLDYIPEKQLCVINKSIIKNIKEFNFKNKVDYYTSLISRLNYKYFDKLTTTDNNYSKRRSKKVY